MMSETKQSYFVKMRGRVMGPFDPLRLRQMVKQGQLSRTHMLSDDGNNWQRAGDFKELFLTEASRDIENVAAAAVNSSVQAESQQTKSQPSATWHYSLGDQPTGPVTLTELRSIISSGVISARDLVWREGMEDWIAANAAPELAALFFSGAKPKHEVETGIAGIDTQPNNAELLETRLIVRGTSPWVVFLSYFLFVLGALLFCAVVLSLVLGSPTENPRLIVSAIVMFVQMCVVLTAAYFLDRYSFNCRKFVKSMNVNDLGEGLRWLGRFWILTSIIMIVWLAFLFLLFILAANTSLTFFDFVNA